MVSARYSPSLVCIVWRGECIAKSPAKRGRRFPSILGARARSPFNLNAAPRPVSGSSCTGIDSLLRPPPALDESAPLHTPAHPLDLTFRGHAHFFGVAVVFPCREPVL
jgi:hypothetical protein